MASFLPPALSQKQIFTGSVPISMNLFFLLNRLSRSTKQTIQVLADSALILIAFALAMFLRLESWRFVGDRSIWTAFAPVIPLTVGFWASMGLYRTVVRYISATALKVLLLGALISAFGLSLADLAIGSPVPRSVPFIHAMMVFGLAGGVRFLIWALFRRTLSSSRKAVFVYGAGDAGRQLVNALHHGREYHPVAFLDDDAALLGSTIGGLRVFSPLALPSLIKDTRAQTVLLAIPSATRARRREIVAAIEVYGLKIKTIPGMADIVSGKAKFSELRSVRPEDLLGRDPVEPNSAMMQHNISGKVVLVSGAGGSIGSELCRQIIELKPTALVLFEISEFSLYAIDAELREALARSGRSVRLVPLLGSVCDAARVRAVLDHFKVQTIYHAAAYKHVPLVEENVIEGLNNNVFGTMTIARAAAEVGVENFILISTDKAVRPTNIMGASKRMAELVCQALARDSYKTVFSMVRFGNVLGSSGSVIPLFQAQIERGGPVTVTHRDINRFFMTIPEAAQLVIQAGAMARGGDVFVLDMGEPVKILDLALSMVRMNGLVPYIVDTPEAEIQLRGDIQIQVTGLRKGEKLFEELLIGDSPTGTEHPRILTATETSLDPEALQALLDQLAQACRDYDVPRIRTILIAAPLAYRPTAMALSDHVWDQKNGGLRP